MGVWGSFSGCLWVCGCVPNGTLFRTQCTTFDHSLYRKKTAIWDTTWVCVISLYMALLWIGNYPDLNLFTKDWLYSPIMIGPVPLTRIPCCEFSIVIWFQGEMGSNKSSVSLLQSPSPLPSLLYCSTISILRSCVCVCARTRGQTLLLYRNGSRVCWLYLEWKS